MAARSPIKPPRWSHSLKFRIVVSYSLILILGGVSTSIIGIDVTGRALRQQARQQTVYGLALAHAIYAQHQVDLRRAVETIGTQDWLQRALASGNTELAARQLDHARQKHGLSFLFPAAADGRVLVGAAPDQVQLAPLTQALSGTPSASTELILASPRPGTSETGSEDILVALVVVPVRDDAGNVVGTLCAGEELGGAAPEDSTPRNHQLVDQIHTALSGSAKQGCTTELCCAATIFRGDVRVSTTIADTDGRRAVGTHAPPEALAAVMQRSESWTGLTEVLGERFITACEPLLNSAGRPVGMLAVGLSEHPSTAVRNRVTLSFAGIALFCFLLIVLVTYFLTRSLVRPLEEMVLVSQRIAAGDLSHRVRAMTDGSEFSALALSFNDMLERISQMKRELQEWGKTLEEKVEERTEQLSEVQAQAARQERLASVGQLAAGVAHEINNPLGGILTFASLVLEDLRPDDPHREDIEEIVRQAVRCRKIVTGLLEFSRQHETNMVPANVNQVLNRTLALLETQTIFHDVKVARRLDSNMPSAVMDESQMQQVFMNLIINAVDAMDGHGSITIETRHSKERKELQVRITDTGCGIPEDIRESIFDPFFTTKDPGKGTGLGLAVTWKIIQTHKGRLEVESEVGKGTTFTILLPLQE